jgi:hypothetical protein
MTATVTATVTVTVMLTFGILGMRIFMRVVGFERGGGGKAT